MQEALVTPINYSNTQLISRKFVFLFDINLNILYISPLFSDYLGYKSSILNLKEIIEDDSKEDLYIRLEVINNKSADYIDSMNLIFKMENSQLVKMKIYQKMNSKESKSILCIAIPDSDPISDYDLSLVFHLLNKINLNPSLSPIIYNKDHISPISSQIIQIFEKTIHFQNQLNDKWLLIGKQYFESQIDYFILRNIKLEFLLPAFPFKSRNTQKKVLGNLPDKGEKLALELLNNFCNEIEKIYPAGANCTIVSDGRVFADVMEVDDLVVTQYNAEIREIAKELNLNNLKFFGLEDFLDRCENHQTARDKLLYFYGKDIISINEQIKKDPDYAKMFCGFNKFIMEDIFNIVEKENIEKKSELSKKAIKRNLKFKAKNIMLRNDAYSTMVQNLYPLHIRLSIHAHDNSGPKFAIRLLPFDKVSQILVADRNLHIPTPWHNVVVEDEFGKFFLMKKIAVEELKNSFEIVKDEKGRLSHFKAK